jgi:hypothetical protein
VVFRWPRSTLDGNRRLYRSCRGVDPGSVRAQSPFLRSPAMIPKSTWHFLDRIQIRSELANSDFFGCSVSHTRSSIVFSLSRWMTGTGIWSVRDPKGDIMPEGGIGPAPMGGSPLTKR